MIYEKANGTTLPAAGLLFEGSTYDLGWDGQRTTVALESTVLPTADFALFLINAVKFHCGRLW
jgi:proline utilization trans-activator